MAWTEQQQEAIDLDDKNILVSAAAGSGKTAVLAERVLTHLLRPEHAPGSWNVDELLIVTFTKAAAAEMSERIGQRLQQAIAGELAKEKPDRQLVARLEKQIILLSGAAISTIDSFCQSIIKNNFAAIDLDPKFRVADENELLLLQQDVLDELFESRYEAEDEALVFLGDKYGSDRGDGRLYDIVLKLYHASRNQPFPEAWLHGLAEDFRPQSAEKLKDYSRWWPVVMGVLSEGLTMAEDNLAEFRALVQEVDTPDVRSKYDERLERAELIVGKIRNAIQAGDWEDIWQAFSHLDDPANGFLRMPGVRKGIDGDLKKQINAANDAVKKAVTDLKDKYILDREEVMVQDLRELAGDAAAMVELTLAFSRAYAAAKAERNVIDYSDMEHFALQLLMGEGSVPGAPVPSDTALALRQKYREIMVDEYQDTNEVQDTIVKLIAGEGKGNMFTVGDVKQSIYSFRSSDPGLFIRKYEAYGAESGGEKESVTLSGQEADREKEPVLLSGQAACGLDGDLAGDGLEMRLDKAGQAMAESLAGAGTADASDGLSNKGNRLITLGRNFRSRREILSAVNFVFAQLMTKKNMEIEYDDRAMLNPGDPYGYKEPEEGTIMPLEAAVELDIILEESKENTDDGELELQDATRTGVVGQAAGTAQAATGTAWGSLDGSGDSQDAVGMGATEEAEREELKAFQLEAQHIANRLKELKAQNYLVFDKSLVDRNNGYRPVQWRDMVILLRATKGKAEVVQDVFRANDIPVFAATEGGYFQTTEIQVVTALLSVIDNARQDIPLATVLYSPIVGLSAEQLATLRICLPEGSLYEAVMEAGNVETVLPADIKGKLEDFQASLSRWRQLSQSMGVAELLWHLYRETGYYDYVGCMPGGTLRQANLRMLISRAEAFAATNFRGLFRFLSFIEKIKSLDTDLSTARTLGENEDVVRVMTIHKSKGLEFPVVVLADLGKGFNLMDIRDSVLLHKDLGLGLDTIDLAKSVKYPSFARMAVKAKLLQETKAEELRVLYVAMTRAREKLILVGRVKSGAAAVKGWCRYREADILPGYAVSRAGSYLDWLAMTVARHEAGSAFAAWMGLNEAQYVQSLGHMHSAMGRESQWQVQLLPAGDISLPETLSKETGEVIEAVLRGQPLPVADSVTAGVSHILDWHYDFQGRSVVPAKLSVSEMKRRFALEMDQGEMPSQNLPGLEGAAGTEQGEYTFPKPVFLQRQEEGSRPKLSGAAYGTLMHTVMQQLDLSQTLDRQGIKKQLARLVEREVITQDQAGMVNLKYVSDFFASNLGQRLLGAAKLWRELPFSRMLAAKDYCPGVTDETAEIFNQGVIDVLFQEAGGDLVLIDYKTDWDTDPDRVREKYSLQLALYAQAVESVFGQPPAEQYLCMLRDGTVVRLQ